MAEKKSETFTLYSPNGEKYQTGSKVEATRLRAYGYTDKAPKSAAKSDKS